MTDKPIKVGDIVHYRSRATADGVLPPVCRAAIVTMTDADDPFFTGLCVLNPTGIRFDGDILYGHLPGRWHWPVECGEQEE